MLFNSYAFIFGFFPLVLILFHLCAQINARYAIILLTLASLVFYAWDSLSTLPLLILSIVFNYIVGYFICTRKVHSGVLGSRAIVNFGVLLNLAALGAYKYANLLIDAIDRATVPMGLQSIPAVNIYLPAGISFFTFTQIAYLVDCYRYRISERNPVDYALFVSFFPHLIAGPLLHHGNVIPQLKNIVTTSRDINKISIGFAIFVIGLAKKILLADNLAYYVDAVYESIEMGSDPMLFVSWVAMLGYTFQIYFDFSGYSDMAMGLAIFFGITIPLNFNSPYQATGIIEFWRRWHISLSNFLRDYLYVPLGGNRSGEVRKYINICITMLIGGLWHGASWTFAIWGAIHGMLLLINHASRRLLPKFTVPKLIAWTITFFLVNLTWIVFRSPNWEIMGKVVRGLFGLNGISIPEGAGKASQLLLWLFPNANHFGIWQGINGGMGSTGTLEICGLILISLTITALMPNAASLLLQNEQPPHFFRRAIKSRVLGISISILFWLSVMNFSKPSPFLYFRF